MDAQIDEFLHDDSGWVDPLAVNTIHSLFTHSTNASNGNKMHIDWGILALLKVDLFVRYYKWNKQKSYDQTTAF